MRKDSMGESYRRGALKLTTCHPGPCVPVTHPVGAPEGPQGSSLRWDNNPRVLRPCFWSHSKGLFFQGLAGAELVPKVTRVSSSVHSPPPPHPRPVSSRSSLEFCEENLPTRPVGGARPFPQWEASPSSGIKRLLFFLSSSSSSSFLRPFSFSLEFIPGQTFLVCFRPISISLQTWFQWTCLASL